MRARGITYDTGWVRNGAYSRPAVEPGVVQHELTVIRDELHCTAVRISGGDPDRLEEAARIAAGLGLEVWFSPYPIDLTHEEALALFAECAERAERLRRTGAEVVFVTGAELSLMIHGFLPGATLDERLGHLFAASAQGRGGEFAAVGRRVNAFLADAVALVRKRFGGRVTYASIPIDQVDWDLFDIVSVDLYRSAEIADRFAEGVRTLVASGKPVAITEFGSGTFTGAGDIGARGLEIVETDGDGRPVRIAHVLARDEEGQAGYLRELLEVFDTEGVDSTFVFVFALHDFPHRPHGDPRDDLDLASYGIVKVRDDGSWEPKLAFGAVAEFHTGATAAGRPAT